MPSRTEPYDCDHNMGAMLAVMRSSFVKGLTSNCNVIIQFSRGCSASPSSRGLPLPSCCCRPAASLSLTGIIITDRTLPSVGGWRYYIPGHFRANLGHMPIKENALENLHVVYMCWCISMHHHTSTPKIIIFERWQTFGFVTFCITLWFYCENSISASNIWLFGQCLICQSKGIKSP